LDEFEGGGESVEEGSRTRVRRGLGPGILPSRRFGAIPHTTGTQFVIFSRHATAVSLLLFDPSDEEVPTDEVVLDPEMNRRGDVWYVFVPGVLPGALYAWRIDGPHDPSKGHRFDGTRIILDPCAKATTACRHQAERERGERETAPRAPIGKRSVYQGASGPAPRCVVVSDDFNWGHHPPPRTHLADSVIYEVHLAGFTRRPDSGVRHPGTYTGFIEKIPYLKELGITAVELLPVAEFDPHELNRHDPFFGRPLVNYWGYSPVSFFAPHGGYAHDRETPGAQVAEFKSLVRELHQAGIEVILDVVFNHTAEGNESGPVINYKAIDNGIYYFIESDGVRYRDFSGCGNSINSNHPVVRDHIISCLHYWVTQMEVDGFRFDLASVLSRDRFGHLMANPPLLESISEDPILRDTKIIAEAWDAAGAYQVGSFPGGRWAEWNGRFRDDLRDFWRGAGNVNALATRLTGSSDLYQGSARKPWHSINFITCHDGFTLNDLVTHERKHNAANGEQNRDGENHNRSHHLGVEGPTDDVRIDRLRVRRIKSMLTSLMFSQGVPMILGGDEFRRTQLGNNNAYCQDNEISWFDWSLLERHRELHRFTRELIWFRRRHPILRRREFFSGAPTGINGRFDIEWYEPDGRPRDWYRDEARLMCFLSGLPVEDSGEAADDDLVMMINAGTDAVPFTLPEGNRTGMAWRLFADSSADAPFDIFPGEDGPRFSPGQRFRLEPGAMAVFQQPHRT
jgi:glycogen operon protein